MSIPDPQRTICPKCGSTEREGEDFCVCGEYLGWDDPEVPSEETDAAPAPEPPRPDDRPDVASIDLRTPDREHRPGTRVRRVSGAAPSSRSRSSCTRRATRGPRHATSRRSSGRRAGHHEVTVRNRGNTHLDAWLEAIDDDGVARPSFTPPLLDLGPGEQRVSRLEVRPPAPIIAGRDRDLPLKVLAHAGDREPVSADATYRQRAWLPWWAIAVLIALVVLVVLVLLV